MYLESKINNGIGSVSYSLNSYVGLLKFRAPVMMAVHNCQISFSPNILLLLYSNLVNQKYLFIHNYRTNVHIYIYQQMHTHYLSFSNSDNSHQLMWDLSFVESCVAGDYEPYYYWSPQIYHKSQTNPNNLTIKVFFLEPIKSN